jgi:hypothetical protein
VHRPHQLALQGGPLPGAQVRTGQGVLDIVLDRLRLSTQWLPRPVVRGRTRKTGVGTFNKLGPSWRNRILLSGMIIGSLVLWH